MGRSTCVVFGDVPRRRIVTVGKLSITTLLLKCVLEIPFVLWIHGKIQRRMILSIANRERRAQPFYNVGS